MTSPTPITLAEKHSLFAGHRPTAAQEALVLFLDRESEPNTGGQLGESMQSMLDQF